MKRIVISALPGPVLPGPPHVRSWIVLLDCRHEKRHKFPVSVRYPKGKRIECELCVADASKTEAIT